MKATELRKKSKEDLLKLLNSIKEDMEKVSRELITGKEKNVRKIRFLRRDYARVKTILKEKN